MSSKIENHEKIAMLAVSSLNTISSLISKALTDDTISDEEYTLILLEFETFRQMKFFLQQHTLHIYTMQRSRNNAAMAPMVIIAHRGTETDKNWPAV